MNGFEPHEVAFLESGRLLGRIATVGRDGTPHVVPVGWSFNRETETIDVSGEDFAGTKKYRDVAGSGRAAIVIDEVLPPWSPRGIEVRGAAEALAGPPAMIRIHPDRVRSWGLDTTPDRTYRENVRP